MFSTKQQRRVAGVREIQNSNQLRIELVTREFGLELEHWVRVDYRRKDSLAEQHRRRGSP